ncbi:MAG TPA: hypothetical protein VJ922_05365 [Actinomycetota bacterium]|nr:hypothetical protein [Actinomycetota bacterium]
MRFVGRVLVDCSDVGRRVTVRRRLAEGGYTDVVGILERCDEETFGVRDRNGILHTVDWAAVVAAKVVPPAPAR